MNKEFIGCDAYEILKLTNQALIEKINCLFVFDNQTEYTKVQVDLELLITPQVLKQVRFTDTGYRAILNNGSIIDLFLTEYQYENI